MTSSDQQNESGIPQSGGIERRRWWRIWIYPRFQGTLLAINAGVMAAIFGLIAFLSYRSYQHLKQLGLDSQMPANHPYFQFLYLQFEGFCYYLVFAFALSVFLTSFATLILSHRLAGPIVRLKGFFGKIASSGQLSLQEKVTFRNGDFFSELPELINTALEKIHRGKP